jgi:hypothetical protein
VSALRTPRAPGGRHEDERTWCPRPAPREQALDHRQPECGRLARAGLRTSEEIDAAQSDRNGLGLNRGRRVVAQTREGGTCGGAEAQLQKHGESFVPGRGFPAAHQGWSGRVTAETAVCVIEARGFGRIVSELAGYKGD